jgi:hypothetical protein
MKADLNHVLLTRFNLPSAGAESFIRAREHWLRQRVSLFEQYCLPSVRAQTVLDLAWIIYLDPESPAWLKDRMAEHAALGTFTPIFREQVSRSELLADIQAVVRSPGARLVTTNLDNDDGLATNFAERVQAVSLGPARRAVYIDSGLIVRNEELYVRRDRRNAFCSVAESWSSPVTCWSEWHTDLAYKMPVAHISGTPGWLQAIHGDNVSNRVRGHRVSPSTYRGLFAGLLDELPEPSAADWAAEYLTGRPRRAVRELARGAAKRAVFAVGGRDGIEALHERWNALRARAKS